MLGAGACVLDPHAQSIVSSATGQAAAPRFGLVNPDRLRAHGCFLPLRPISFRIFAGAVNAANVGEDTKADLVHQRVYEVSDWVWFAVSTEPVPSE